MSGSNKTNGVVAKKVSKPRRSSARTLEAREKRAIRLAMDLAEKQLKEGTASAQVITHLLKLGSVSEGLQREKLRNENKLLQAKAESLASNARVETLYADALKAMRQYSGQSIRQEQEEEEYD